MIWKLISKNYHKFPTGHYRKEEKIWWILKPSHSHNAVHYVNNMLAPEPLKKKGFNLEVNVVALSEKKNNSNRGETEPFIFNNKLQQRKMLPKGQERQCQSTVKFRGINHFTRYSYNTMGFVKIPFKFYSAI